MITKKIIADAGRLWKNSEYNFSPKVLITTATGRIIIFNDTKTIRYSDDNGKTFANAQLDSRLLDSYGLGVGCDVCVTSTGRIIAGMSGITWNPGIIYSDDNGETWTYHSVPGLTEPKGFSISSTGKIFASAAGSIYYSDDNGETWLQVAGTVDSAGKKVGARGSEGSIYITPTGRIITNKYSGGICYSDNNGETWTDVLIQSGEGDIDTVTKILLSNNRLFLCCGYGVYYSDDNGETWTRTTASAVSFCVTPTGRIIAGGSREYDTGIWYSDDNGVNWTQSNRTDGREYYLCIMPTGRVIASNSNGIWYSDPEIQLKYTSKPLTGKQAKALVQQCKAYVQELKNGN